MQFFKPKPSPSSSPTFAGEALDGMDAGAGASAGHQRVDAVVAGCGAGARTAATAASRVLLNFDLALHHLLIWRIFVYSIYKESLSPMLGVI